MAIGMIWICKLSRIVGVFHMLQEVGVKEK